MTAAVQCCERWAFRGEAVYPSGVDATKKASGQLGRTCHSGIINQWQQESKDKVISLLLTHLPLLKPGNLDAKVEYMKLLPKILAHSIEHSQHIEESRQLLSYALIHPATSLEDRSALAMWLNHLEDRTSTSFGGQSRGRSDSVDYGQTHYYHQRQNSDDKLNGWQNSRDSGICINASNWQDKSLGCENGHVPLYSSSSVPTTINTIGTSTSTKARLTLPSEHPRKTKPLSGDCVIVLETYQNPLLSVCYMVLARAAEPRGMGGGPAVLLVPQQKCPAPQRVNGQGMFSTHTPPPPYLATSSLEATPENSCRQALLRVASQESPGEAALNKPILNVPAWLKSLRLHKYAALFSQMTYEEMMALTECQLEAQDIIEGGSLRIPLQELHQMILTPIKAYSSPSTTPEARRRDTQAPHPPSLIGPESQSPDCKDGAVAAGATATATASAGASGGLQPGLQPHQLSSCEGELAVTPLPEGDLPGQFTRVMGKEAVLSKSAAHTDVRNGPWSDGRSTDPGSATFLLCVPLMGIRGFGQSNSLPTASSVGGGMGRRNPRQYQIPSRNVPSARLGLLGTSGFVSSTPRNTAANPTIMKQGRQNLWFANPGGSNSMPSRTHSSVQRTRSLPVHTSPQNMLMFQQPEFQLPVTEPDINNRLESLCLSMTEHALGGVQEASMPGLAIIFLVQRGGMGQNTHSHKSETPPSRVGPTVKQNHHEECAVHPLMFWGSCLT
ncbi:sterile alpha motif domain containing 4-like protein [Camelus ferus]|nr:sterile alpha motif domain containing 4-like protein [Camelus ferus]